MSRRLSGYVLASGPEGTVLLSPDEDVPDWAEDVIDNPKAWVDGSEPEGDDGSEPEGDDESEPEGDEKAKPSRRRR